MFNFFDLGIAVATGFMIHWLMVPFWDLLKVTASELKRSIQNWIRK
jgi:hypothetical protein